MLSTLLVILDPIIFAVPGSYLSLIVILDGCKIKDKFVFDVGTCTALAGSLVVH